MNGAVVQWFVITLLIVWIIIRDRAIWPMIFGTSVGAPYLIDSYELSWIPSELVAIFKKYARIAVPKLKENAKKALTKSDIDNFEMMMKQLSDDAPTFKVPMTTNAPSGSPPGASAPSATTPSGTSGYMMPTRWVKSVPSQWFVTA